MIMATLVAAPISGQCQVINLDQLAGSHAEVVDNAVTSDFGDVVCDPYAYAGRTTIRKTMQPALLRRPSDGYDRRLRRAGGPDLPSAG